MVGEIDFEALRRRKAELGLNRDVAYPIEEGKSVPVDYGRPRVPIDQRIVTHSKDAVRGPSALESMCQHCYGDLNTGSVPDECTGYCLGG